MNAITLKQLRYFAALARHQHFGRAAEDCAISQPALSAQIRDLEAALGVDLMERSGRTARLSAFGHEVAVRSARILAEVDALTALARTRQGPLTGRLGLGIIPTVAPYILPSVVRAITAAYPSVELNVRETLTSRLLSELGDGSIDAAIVALPTSEAGLIETALLDEEFLLVRPAAEAGQPIPSHNELKAMRVLLLEEGHCFRDQALSFCGPRRGAAQPRELLDGTSLSTLVQMVGAGMGVTLLPAMAIDVETRAADVALSRFPEPAPGRTIGMVWRRSDPLSERLAELAACLRTALETTPLPKGSSEDARRVEIMAAAIGD